MAILSSFRRWHLRDEMPIREIVRRTENSQKLRISIEGELAELITSILARKTAYKVRTLPLIVDDRGHRFTYTMLRTAFDTARETAGVDKNGFQFRAPACKSSNRQDRFIRGYAPGAKAIRSHHYRDD